MLRKKLPTWTDKRWRTSPATNLFPSRHETIAINALLTINQYQMTRWSWVWRLATVASPLHSSVFSSPASTDAATGRRDARTGRRRRSISAAQRWRCIARRQRGVVTTKSWQNGKSRYPVVTPLNQVKVHQTFQKKKKSNLDPTCHRLFFVPGGLPKKKKKKKKWTWGFVSHLQKKKKEMKWISVCRGPQERVGESSAEVHVDKLPRKIGRQPCWPSLVIIL